MIFTDFSGDYSAAISDAERCLAIDPSFLKGYYRLVSAQLGAKKLKEAEASIKDALDMATQQGVEADFGRLSGQLAKARDAGAQKEDTGPPKPTAKDFAIGDEIGQGGTLRKQSGQKRDDVPGDVISCEP